MLALVLVGLLALPASAAPKLDKAAARVAEELLEKFTDKGANVAVLPFQDATGRPVELGRAFAEALSRELLKSGKVTVLDRGYISRMLGEMKLGMAGLTDPKTALQVGRFSGAKYQLVGSFSGAGDDVTVDAKLVVTETATLAAAARAELRLDADLRKLLEAPAATDPGTALFDEERLETDAVFLERPGKDGCRWIAARADVPAGRDVDEGRAAALALARRKASALLLGRDPGKAPDFSEAAFSGQLEDLLRATKSSRQAAESVVNEQRKGGRHLLTVEACLKPAKGGGDLRVELMLNQSRFVEGQDARAIVTVNHPARVYLFSADFSGKVWPVFPVGPASDNALAPEKPLVFPDETARGQGVRMRAQLPAGRKTSVEFLRVLAVDGEPGTLLDGRTEWAGVVAALEDAGLAWAEDARVFTVYSR
ncbi:DUF4384 domain-containing protein [bacterium]|nr:MAG: DUF4384 domain-containing protein [bacterium]